MEKISEHKLIEWLEEQPFCCRERKLSRYEESFDLNIMMMGMTIRGFTWYDMCCGEFFAGEQLAKTMAERGLERKIVGVDLITPRKVEYGTFCRANVATFHPQDADLITCLFGFMYLKKHHDVGEIIQDWYAALKPGGVLAFNHHDEKMIPEIKRQLGSLMRQRDKPFVHYFRLEKREGKRLRL